MRLPAKTPSSQAGMRTASALSGLFSRLKGLEEIIPGVWSSTHRDPNTGMPIYSDDMVVAFERWWRRRRR